ncbi:hypothetical protein [Hugenholtzia roseola]|uniref:hypothetical protein n=1 Tax=Hugenholtzia roseola TaxID=1002 RepID=UPI00047D9F54|nr:hypothetical protein [Hugenholtzia roseola]
MNNYILIIEDITEYIFQLTAPSYNKDEHIYVYILFWIAEELNHALADKNICLEVVNVEGIIGGIYLGVVYQKEFNGIETYIENIVYSQIKSIIQEKKISSFIDFIIKAKTNKLLSEKITKMIS